VRSLQELEQEEQLCVQFSLICIITSVCGIFFDTDSVSYCNANKWQLQGYKTAALHFSERIL